MNFPEHISAALKNLGIASMNEMQQAALEASAQPNDLILLSPTGSGKTLGFLLPLLNTLDPDKKAVQALIITPTRELAIQIESVFRGMGTAFKVNATYGGHSIRVEENNFSQAPAVLVGTPGRIVDHLNRRNIDLSYVKTLVLDEFDKSLEMGFQEDMGAIIQKLGSVKKRMLISATDLEVIPEFTRISNPVKLSFLTGVNTQLTLKKVLSPDTDKLYTLRTLLCNLTSEPTLIFCNHRESVERISDFLSESGITNVFFHGGLEQDQRERTLIKFRNGSANYMVTTDLAARGLDIPDIQHVIHYQAPLTEDAFIHRNGRTARQTASGTAYLLLSQNEQQPEYIDDRPEIMKLNDDKPLPHNPQWTTLYFSGGKKDKINKIDLVGFLSKVGALEKHDIGLIIVQDYSSFAAVSMRKSAQLMAKIRNEKVKGKKLKIAIAK